MKKWTAAVNKQQKACAVERGNTPTLGHTNAPEFAQVEYNTSLKTANPYIQEVDGYDRDYKPGGLVDDRKLTQRTSRHGSTRGLRSHLDPTDFTQSIAEAFETSSPLSSIPARSRRFREVTDWPLTSPEMDSTPILANTAESSHTTVILNVDYDDGHKTLEAGFSITYQELITRIDAKIFGFSNTSIARGTMRLLYKDRDGDYLTISCDEDVRMVFDDWLERKKDPSISRRYEEIELFCRNVETIAKPVAITSPVANTSPIATTSPVAITSPAAISKSTLLREYKLVVMGGGDVGKTELTIQVSVISRFTSVITC
jgi:hypothetical protein